ncbi:hypothetical protein DXG01_015933 [Tephrocybe rancida]|nr:hypothetical protein DXG01_015933 [Tephrocybe rancida]
MGNSRRPEITQANLVDIFLFHGDSRQQILHYPEVINPSDQAGRINAQVNDSWWGDRATNFKGKNISYPYYWVLIPSGTTLDTNAIAQPTFTAVQTTLADFVVASISSSSASAASVSSASAAAASASRASESAASASAALSTVTSTTSPSSSPSVQSGSSSKDFPHWAIAVIVVLGFLAIAATCVLVFLIMRRMRRRQEFESSNRNSMGSASPMMANAGGPSSPLLGAGALGGTGSIAGHDAARDGASMHDGASTMSRAGSAGNEAPFSGEDAAIMADAFRKMLRKPDFAARRAEEGESPDGPDAEEGRGSILGRELAEEGRDIRSVRSERGVKVETLSDGDPRWRMDWERAALSLSNAQRSNWLSLHYPKTVSWWGSRFMISIVLDNGTYADFSGIRVLILEEPSLNVGLSEVELEDHITRERETTQRKTLERKRRLHQAVLDKSQPLASAKLAKPLCTLAFYLRRDVMSFRAAWLELVSGEARANGSRRVVYDGTRPCNADSHSVWLLFSSDYRVTPFRSNKDYSFQMPKGFESSLCVRILPVTPTQNRIRESPVLPRTVLRQIFQEALKDDRKWRRSMFAYGMVCKAWSHIFDIFIGWLSDNSEVINIHALARSLTLKPERGRLIRTISLANFKDFWKYHKQRDDLWGDEDDDISHTDERVMDALVTVLRLTPLVQNLYLPSLRAPLRTDIIETLARLTEVETASVSSYEMINNNNPISAFTMSDIQHLIADWTKLRQLIIERWSDDGEIALRSPKHPHFELQRLELKCGHLNGAQLRWFTLAPKACLKDVNLKSIKGLSNSSLVHFLSAISATIVKLSITECPITRYSATETPAFDAVLPQMTMLEEATLYRDIVSAAAIARGSVRGVFLEFCLPAGFVDVDGG